MQRKWRTNPEALKTVQSYPDFRAAIPARDADYSLADPTDLYAVYTVLHIENKSAELRWSTHGGFYFYLVQWQSHRDAQGQAQQPIAAPEGDEDPPPQVTPEGSEAAQGQAAVASGAKSGEGRKRQRQQQQQQQQQQHGQQQRTGDSVGAGCQPQAARQAELAAPGLAGGRAEGPACAADARQQASGLPDVDVKAPRQHEHHQQQQQPPAHVHGTGADGGALQQDVIASQQQQQQQQGAAGPHQAAAAATAGACAPDSPPAAAPATTGRSPAAAVAAEGPAASPQPRTQIVVPVSSGYSQLTPRLLQRLFAVRGVKAQQLLLALVDSNGVVTRSCLYNYIQAPLEGPGTANLELLDD